MKRSVEAGMVPDALGPLPRAAPIYAYMLVFGDVTESANTTFIFYMQGMFEEAILDVVGATPPFTSSSRMQTVPVPLNPL